MLKFKCRANFSFWNFIDRGDGVYRSFQLDRLRQYLCRHASPYYGAAERPGGVDQNRSMLYAERIPPGDGGGFEFEIAETGLDNRSEDLLPLFKVDHPAVVVLFSDLQKDRFAVGPKSLC